MPSKKSPLRIAYLSQTYPPMISGAAIVVQRLAEGIVARGHSAMVLAASDKGLPYSCKENGVDVVRLRSYRNRYRIDQHFMIWPQMNIHLSFRDYQPDVIHFHDPMNFGLAGLMVARQQNIPSVLTIHQLPWFITSYIGKTQQIRDMIENSLWQYSKWFVGKCNLAISPSHFTAGIVEVNLNYSPVVISNGVDIDLFSPLKRNPCETQELCEKYGIDPDQPVILFVGRIDPDKKVDVVIQAASIVMQEIPVQLLIVGNGTQRNEMIRVSKSLGIYERCHFPGFVPKSEDLPGLYRLATIFVTASEIEIQSSVVLESAASGLPVITVDTSSMSEFVIDGVNGYLVQPGDIDAIAERIKYLLNNPVILREMGKAGRKIAQKHSSEEFISTHEKLYESILSKTKE